MYNVVYKELYSASILVVKRIQKQNTIKGNQKHIPTSRPTNFRVTFSKLWNSKGWHTKELQLAIVFQSLVCSINYLVRHLWSPKHCHHLKCTAYVHVNEVLGLETCTCTQQCKIITKELNVLASYLRRYSTKMKKKKRIPL